MRAVLVVLVLAAGPAWAVDDEAAALSLADKTVTAKEAARDWKAFAEAAWSETRSGGGAAPVRGERLSLDVVFDKTVATNLRMVLADRLDARWPDRLSGEEHVNTLKEAYGSWQARPDLIADLGRINTRYGVAAGYNPTDYFRADALRSVVSIDPASLRENRLGSVMLRGQALWANASFTGIFSPRLASRPGGGAFDPDFGATNRRDRWQLIASRRFSEAIDPQWLIHGAAGQAPQLGLDVTTLLGEATVAYAEWSGGRASSLLARALARREDSAFRSRLAAGLTYTTSSKVSLTLEYQYNGAGLGAEGWDALRGGSALDYGRYRAFASDLQDPPTKERLFLRAFWQDALVSHLDLTAIVFDDRVDSSRQYWAEARYHWSRVDFALQWQGASGRPGSEFVGAHAQRTWQARVAYFF